MAPAIGIGNQMNVVLANLKNDALWKPEGLVAKVLTNLKEM